MYAAEAARAEKEKALSTSVTILAVTWSLVWRISESRRNKRRAAGVGSLTRLVPDRRRVDGLEVGSRAAAERVLVEERP